MMKVMVSSFLYEFMPNGSLESHLCGKSRSTDILPWVEKYKISQGLASALLYLNEGWNRQQCMVHQDTTGLAGTRGYLAPEYLSTGKASKESDVHSFAVVAEIAAGKKSLVPITNDSEMGLVEWVWDRYGKEQLLLQMSEIVSGMSRGFGI
ncbi:putative non-specific serine/threonine protein kinase [Rosa chinensis]|uniref:Putative non-specific serine/threonine protein kinase n=1 Tax=Rosa chinensis TaxID=74649 RepID=A0A2P6RPN1_ROSCH|nr:putative non-specific serine/threonine protein kinase [Rosa chinensis]